jgi:hypothetical protein
MHAARERAPSYTSSSCAQCPYPDLQQVMHCSAHRKAAEALAELGALWPAALPTALHAVHAFSPDFVIQAPLLGVSQDLVRLLQLLEACCGCWVVLHKGARSTLVPQAQASARKRGWASLTHTTRNMSQAIRHPAEEGALAVALREEAERLGVQLVVGPWRDVADLPTVSLETCFARRRRGQRGHGVGQVTPIYSFTHLHIYAHDLVGIWVILLG